MSDPWRDTPTLVGRHVTLRPLVRADRDAVVAASEEGRIGNLFVANAPDADSADGWLDHTFAEQSYGRAMPFAVLAADGRLVGTTRFMRIKRADRRVEIGGTFYAPSAQRTGVNTEAKLLLLTHAFETLECLCVQLRADWLNQRSRRAIERLGAKQDGVLRNHRVMRDGRVRDTVSYSIIATEWPGVRANLDHLLARHEGDKP